MAEKDRFTEQEWKALAGAPLATGAAVVALDHSGLIAMFKELKALAKAVKQAEKESGWPPVITELMETVENKGSSSEASTNDASDYESTFNDAMAALSEAGQAAAKLTPDELDAYVKWVLGIGTATAGAVTEKGSSTPISDAERDALADMERRLRSG